MRRFWFFTEDAGNRPHYPAGVTPKRASYVQSIYRLGTTAAHAHLWIGGFARPDARLTGTGALHFHDLVNYGGQWYSLTTGATEHQHEVPESPDYWLICASLDEADVPACAADPAMFNLGEIDPASGLSTDAWGAPALAQWQTRFKAGLYLDLPPQVINDARLVAWVLGVFGHTGSEIGYRCPE